MHPIINFRDAKSIQGNKADYKRDNNKYTYCPPSHITLCITFVWARIIICRTRNDSNFIGFRIGKYIGNIHTLYAQGKLRDRFLNTERTSLKVVKPFV